jgi:hypothetical protein
MKLGKQYSEEGILHIPKVSVEKMASICKQKNLHTDLTGDQTQNPLTESPQCYPKTTKSYLYRLFQKEYINLLRGHV